MRVGIVRSGLMGGRLGTIFARAGHEVVFSYARSERKLQTLARNAGGSATHGTPREAAVEADAVLLAVNWSRMQDMLKQAGNDIAAELIRSAGFEPVDGGPLRIARTMEPFALLVAQLAHSGGRGPALAYRFARL